MYHRYKINRKHLAAALAALTLAVTTQAADEPAGSESNDTKKALDLGKVEVRGDNEQPNALPTLPTNSLYGYEQSIKETPRSVFKISKDQLDEDVIQNYNDLARYSPSVQKSTSSPFSTFANIRGGSADTMRNGILLLNPAVRPFDNNSWESADIVAGVPSVAFGSTTRTAGYVNYITKQPFYDKRHTEITTTFGRLGTSSSTTYSQYNVQYDDSGPAIKDVLAYRLSIQDSRGNTYWANAQANFVDIYGALNWKPTKKLSIDANFTYTHSDGAYPYGINRVTQALIDNWTYIAGPTSPILKVGSNYYRGNAAGTSYDAGSVVNGLFVPNGTTTTTAPGTQSNSANLVGWVLRPEDAKTTTIHGNQTLYSKDAFSRSAEYIGQVVSALTLNDTYTLRNNTLYQYSDSYVHGYDEYESFMVNKLITSRLELISNSEFKLFGNYVTHKSNSGFDFRYLWNYCDNVGKPSERPFSSADATDAGTFGVGYSLGLQNLYPVALTSYTSNALVPVLTKYGWVNIAPGYTNSNGRVQGFSINALGGGDVRVNQLSTYGLYTEHNFDFGEAWSWRVGARATRIQDYLRATPITYAVSNLGVLPNYTLSDNDTAWNGDFNTSLTYRPTKWATTYFTYDNDRASADCGCCLTSGFQNFGGLNQGLAHDYFRTVSQLYELGSKFEIIRNQLFSSVAVFHQTRQVPSVPTASSPNPVQVGLIYNGAEVSLTYQPNRHFSVGGNYAYLHATYDNNSAGAVYSDYNGFVADGSTIVNNSSGSIGVNSSARGNFRALGTPLHSLNFWTSYQFDNGFGIKANAWLTSDWQVSRIVWVPVQHSIDLGVFYVNKRWRADVSLRNITDEKNWSPSGNYAGGSTGFLLPSERFGVTGRISIKL